MYGDTAAGRKRVAQLREQGGDIRALAARLVPRPRPCRGTARPPTRCASRIKERASPPAHRRRPPRDRRRLARPAPRARSTRSRRPSTYAPTRPTTLVEDARTRAGAGVRARRDPGRRRRGRRRPPRLRPSPGRSQGLADRRTSRGSDMVTIDLTTPPPPPASFLDGAGPPARAHAARAAPRRRARRRRPAALRPAQRRRRGRRRGLAVRTASARAAARSRTPPTPTPSASLHDPADTLRRRGLVTDAGADPGLVGAVGLLATPRLALDIDVAAGGTQVKAWHRQAGGAVATLSTCDGIVFELAWFPVDQWTAELARVTASPRTSPLGDLRTCPPTSTCPTTSPTRSARRCAPAAPTWCRCWSTSPPASGVLDADGVQISGAEAADRRVAPCTPRAAAACASWPPRCPSAPRPSSASCRGCCSPTAGTP